MRKHTSRRRNTTRTILLGICAVLLVTLIGLLITAGVLTYNENKLLSSVRKEVTVEAGSGSVDPAAFLLEPGSGTVRFVSGVTAQQLCVPGTYPVTLLWNEKEISASVRVVDTVKPSGKTVDLTAMAQAPAASEFVTDIEDVTDVTVSYKTAPDMTVAGTVPVTLVLTDTSGNSAELTAQLTVIVDSQAPVIEGVRAITVYLGDTVSYRAGITATDDYDSAPVLRIDSSGVNLDQVGQYTVVYSATDASGNETSVSATVNVLEKTATSVDLETVYEKADKLISQIIKEDMTQREQVETIYNWVRSNCSYSGHSEKTDFIQGAYVMLTQRSGDCFNYYALTKLLFDRLGIDNIDVRKVKNYDGDSDHYWSLVSLDGGQTWYHFDSTPRVGAGDDFCLVTDAFLDAYSAEHDNCHNRDKTLYPATPEN